MTLKGAKIMEIGSGVLKMQTEDMSLQLGLHVVA